MGVIAIIVGTVAFLAVHLLKGNVLSWMTDSTRMRLAVIIAFVMFVTLLFMAGR